VMNYNLGNDIAVAGVLLGFLAVALNKRWLLTRISHTDE